MPKLTPEQRADLERQLAEDDDDQDFDLHYTEGDRSISVPWSQRHVLEEFGFKGSPKRPAAKAGGQGDGKDPGKSGGAVSVFGPRQRRAGGST
jgi:hypothetical protein